MIKITIIIFFIISFKVVFLTIKNSKNFLNFKPLEFIKICIKNILKLKNKNPQIFK